MPPTIRPQSVILDELLANLTRTGLVTDIAPISVVRQLSSAVATTVAEQYFALYTLYRSFFILMATGEDLDVRGSDVGLPRDVGQAASGDVVYVRANTYADDIVLLAPQHLEPVVDPGLAPPTYATVENARLEPCGRSLSGTAPLTSIQPGLSDSLSIA